MTKFYRVLSFVFWLLGLIATVLTVVWRIVPRMRLNGNFELRSLLLLAGVCFLGALASRAMERPAAAS